MLPTTRWRLTTARCAGGSAMDSSWPGPAGAAATCPSMSGAWASTTNGRAQLKIEVEVANFYPSIAVGFSTPVYEMTQSAIHVLVTNNFLRSLAKLDLAAVQDRVSSGRTRSA